MDTILNNAPIVLFFSSFIILIALAIIDFRHWILPNWLNLLLAITGFLFHLTSGFPFFEPYELFIGAAVGGGILYIIRFFGNRHYKQDTLGLGDVKLMAASGLWLGIEGIVTAMTIGAFAGLVHGVLVSLIRAAKEKTRPNLHRLMIPAGPGFCIGIAIMLIWQYWV
ncbi:MAG: prepilin peptidase [Alphaproteobacteria bacterium]|nr:prepilin peptidase [Alphaproteobacteria bacterium]